MCSSNLKIPVFVTAWLAAAGLALPVFAADAKTISSVEVQEQDGVTRIILRGAEDPIYTAFMREDPPRLIVELPDVVFQGVNSPVRVENDVVNHVTLGAFGDPRVALSMARVSVGLARPSEYELLPNGDTLVIEIRPVAGAPDRNTAAAAPANDFADDPAPADDPVAEDTPPADESAAPADGPTATAPADESASSDDLESGASDSSAAELAPGAEDPSSAMAEAAPAESDDGAPTAAAAASSAAASSKILEVAASADGVEVVAEGPIDNVDSFTLDDPSRLVVDFWGVDNAVWPTRRSVDWRDVSQVRIGRHPDKVRVVFDLRGPIESHIVEPTARGVEIRIVSALLSEEIAPAEEGAPQAADAPMSDGDSLGADAGDAEFPADDGFPTGDAGLPTEDAGLPTDDAGPLTEEAGLPTDAAGLPPEDAGLPTDAAGLPTEDAGLPTDAPGLPTDAGLPGEDDFAATQPGQTIEGWGISGQDEAPGSDGAAALPAALDADPAEATPGEAPEADWDGSASAGTEPGEELTSPLEWTEPAQVETVHFESLPDTDRVVVSLSHPAETEMVTPDDATIIVMLRGAQITEETERRVDTQDFGGPVEHLSVFRTPDVDYDEVRIVLKRQAGTTATLTWDESRLHVEVPRAVAQTWDGDPSDFAADAETAEGAEGLAEPTMPGGPEPGSLELDPAGAEPVPAPSPAPSSDGGAPAAAGLGGEDPFLLDGPADPASIDILEEGGFTDEKEYTGRRISLDFKDADIANILRLIAEVSDLNVIAGEEVAGKVTIRLVDVPWDQALDVILLTKGLGFVRVGNVLRIAPLETLKLEAEARLQDRRAKEKLEDLIVKLQPVNYANVKEVKDLVKKLLSKRGTVNTDKRTNTLIIKDIPSVVQEATALVKAIDTQTPQVLIEAKIVEANLSFSRALGSFWGLQYNATGASGVPSSGGAPDFHLADGANPDVFGIGPQISNFIASNPILDANNGFMSLGLLGLDDHIQLDLAIEAAESNNKGKVISSPRVVTLDNREAIIKQGVAIKFEAATRDKITISFIDAVLELKVTPHITANRSIIMKLKVSRNAPSISASSGEVQGIDKNEANTEALVRDGETIVLGGIYVVDSGRAQTKTPFLADIPLLGVAFQSNSVQDERRELLIFVTPRIITGTPATTDL